MIIRLILNNAVYIKMNSCPTEGFMGIIDSWCWDDSKNQTSVSFGGDELMWIGGRRFVGQAMRLHRCQVWDWEHLKKN